MWTLLMKLSQNLVLAIPVMLAGGFILGLAMDAAPLKALIVPATFLMVYPMMITLKVRQVFTRGGERAQWMAQGLNFLVIPFLALGLGTVFFPDRPDLVLGMLLAGLVPTSGMTISWTGLARGNVAAAVKMTVIGLTLGSLLTPFYVRTLMGAELSVDMAAVLRQIGLIVFVPMLLGYLTQRLLVRRYGQDGFRTLAPRFPGLSVLGVLAIVFVAMALKARSIAAHPDMLLVILVPLALLYAANFLLSTLIARALLPRGDAIALVYGTVMRNLSIALAIAINAFGAQGQSAALVIALAYVIQVQSAAWYVKFTDRLYGPAIADACETPG